MANKTKRALLTLTREESDRLKTIAGSRSLSRREVERANILLRYSEGKSIAKIQFETGLSRPTIYKCIDKALQMGPAMGLKDLPHSPKASGMTLEAKAWVTHVACKKPKDLGFAAELWSLRSLADYIRAHAEQEGHLCLNKAAKATVYRILKEHELQPHKVKYYLEKRDPEFDVKMREVLMVYQEVNLINECSEGNAASEHMVTVCVDEKPGVQAIANTAQDRAPVANKYATIARDYEYKRHGTASILAGIDLHDGHVFAQVHRRHRSVEFIELLKEMDLYYSADTTIRIVLDNHSSHISKETRHYLSTRPGRFVYVHTPKHGSWLNLAETLFGKMARTFLKHIRVNSWDELKRRILKGVEEINNNPVIHIPVFFENA